MKNWFLFSALFGITLLYKCFVAKRKKQKGGAFFDALQEGVVILNGEGKVLNINQKGKTLFDGLEVGDILFQHQALYGHHLLFHKVKETKIPQSGTIRIRKKVVYYELKVLKLRKRILATFMDQYEPYQKEQVGKDFVANASHELRTPITIIKGFAETIHDLPKISEGMLQDFTEKIVRNCERVEGLVKNLLTLADLDYLPKAKMQKCDLVGLIESCSQTLLSVYPKIQVEAFHNKEEIIVSGDPDLLELAIMNLLENAVKYSHREALVTVTVEDLEGKVLLKIADQGVGMFEEDLENIFERFYTINKSHSRQMGGAGLGLSIVKTIMDKHDAKVGVTSTPGQGSTFILTFPKATLFSR